MIYLRINQFPFGKIKKHWWVKSQTGKAIRPILTEKIILEEANEIT